MIRARSLTHLEALIEEYKILSDFEILKSTDADYPVRIIVPRMVFQSLMMALAHDIDYGNFKKEVAKNRDPKYSRFLTRTWSNGLELQEVIWET